jgi:hypothetical protein
MQRLGRTRETLLLRYRYHDFKLIQIHRILLPLDPMSRLVVVIVSPIIIFS